MKLFGNRVEEVESAPSKEDTVDLIQQGVEVFVARVEGDSYWSQPSGPQEDVIHLCDVVTSPIHQRQVVLRSWKSQNSNSQWSNSLLLVLVEAHSLNLGPSHNRYKNSKEILHIIILILY